jgi:predicted acetyltransferase
MAALTPDAARRLWAFLAGHSALNDAVRWFGPPADLLATWVDGSWLEVTSHLSWLIRLIDLPAALQARGYPSAPDGCIHLEVDDPLLPANRGRWQLDVRDGSGTVVSGGEGHLKLSVRALAPLMSGHWSATQLVELGWLRCSNPTQLLLADQVFSSPPPWMPDLF